MVISFYTISLQFKCKFHEMYFFCLQANETGQYYVDCAQAKTAPAGEDDEAAEELWSISEKLVGL